MMPRKPCAIASYRDTTMRMTNAPTMTFLCSICHKGKSIAGRRKVGMLGRKTLWACVACAGKA